MIRLTLTDWSDEKLTDLKALFDTAIDLGYDARLSFEKVDEIED